MRDQRHFSQIEPWRLFATYLLMGALLILFVFNLVDLQLIRGTEFSALADDNRFDKVSIPAPRGVVYDANGSLLVRNIPAFNVTITPALLPESEAEKELIYARLSSLTGVPVDQEGPPAAACVPGRGIRQLVLEGETNRPFDAWPIACDIDEFTARMLLEERMDLPGVNVETVPVRDYSTGELTAPIIGFLGPIPAAEKDFWEELGFIAARDKIGYAGIEISFQDVLAGQNGLKLIEQDVAGLELREVGEGNPAIPGNNLRLTIDTRLQSVATTALLNRMDFLNRFAGETRTAIGVVIAMDPNTGEILAMVSIPSYENNRMARFIPEYYFQQLSQDPNTPLVNHAISLEQPPGSSFKMVTAIGALNEGIISPQDRLFDPGKITITNIYFANDPGKAKDFICWKEDGHGFVDFVHGIAYSCNVYFYKIGGGYEDEVLGDGLGIDNLGVYARALGYGAPLGIDLPGEGKGLIPSIDYKRIFLGESWSTGDTYNSVVGQGFVAATPLQVLTSISTLANGGKVLWPHVVSDILDGEGNIIQHFEPCVLWDIADGRITPLDQIGANCETLPEETRLLIQTSREVTPDVNVDPTYIELTRQGMQLVVTDPDGTAHDYAELEEISSGGKTGTGEFCDENAFNKGLCEPGNWPTHSWYTAFAPFENPEIIVVAFVYNGGEGAVSAGPVVQQVLEAYFELKAIDATR
jgi:penicillin-binding protein 2